VCLKDLATQFAPSPQVGPQKSPPIGWWLALVTIFQAKLDAIAHKAREARPRLWDHNWDK
jgi:hypothetical protein